MCSREAEMIGFSGYRRRTSNRWRQAGKKNAKNDAVNFSVFSIIILPSYDWYDI